MDPISIYRPCFWLCGFPYYIFILKWPHGVDLSHLSGEFGSWKNEWLLWLACDDQGSWVIMGDILVKWLGIYSLTASHIDLGPLKPVVCCSGCNTDICYQLDNDFDIFTAEPVWFICMAMLEIFDNEHFLSSNFSYDLFIFFVSSHCRDHYAYERWCYNVFVTQC